MPCGMRMAHTLIAASRSGWSHSRRYVSARRTPATRVAHAGSSRSPAWWAGSVTEAGGSRGDRRAHARVGREALGCQMVEVAAQQRHGRGPARLVAGADAGAVVSVEVLVE